MRDVRTWVSRRLGLLVLLGTGLGFGLIVAELLLTDHTRGSQLIGVLAAVAGVVLVLVGLLPWRRLRVLVALAFVVLAGTGLWGVKEHLEHVEVRPSFGSSFGRDGAAPPTPASGAALQRVQERRFVPRDGREGGGRRYGLAPLAPLALSGLSVLGALAVLALDGEERRERAASVGAPDASSA